jgi:hypothetical protein
MHYKNGREAKQGDKIINLKFGFSGVLHTVTEGCETCNGRLASISQNDPYITLSECLHVDDIAAAIIPDSTQETPAASATPAPVP